MRKHVKNKSGKGQMERDREWENFNRRIGEARNRYEVSKINFEMAKFLYDEGNYKGCVFMSAEARFCRVQTTNIGKVNPLVTVLEKLLKVKLARSYGMNMWYEKEALRKAGIEHLKGEIEKLYMRRELGIIEFQDELKILLKL